MKKYLHFLTICAVFIFTAGNVGAQITYQYGAGLAPLAGGIGTDAEEYIGNGSWKNDQSVYAFELYLDLSLFGTFTIDEIDYIKYATNKIGLQGDPDFFVKIYTVPYVGGSATWYGNRINAEPYYSNNLNAPSNQWNEWSTSSTINELTFFDQPVTGMFGWAGTQPTLAALQAGAINWNTYNGGAPVTNIDYGAQEIKYIAFGTGGAWNSTFNGYLDQIIVSVNGTEVTWDLEGGLSEVWVDDDWAGSSIGDPVDGHIFGNDAFATIQDGIDAVSGSIVNVAAGTYNENINVKKHVKLIGAGSGSDPATNTIITQSGGNAIPDQKVGVIQLNASGISTIDPLLIKDLRVEPVGMAGISVGRFTQGTGTSVFYVELNNVQVYGNNVNPNTEQERGLYVDKTSSLLNLVITNCAFNNLTYGWYLQKAVSADASTVQYVTVDNTTFNHNNLKGIYAEKLSEATFTNCTASENGFSDAGIPWYFLPWMSGFDINLKSGTYQNLTFTNCTITNNALGGAKEGVGLTVKGRGTGDNPSGSYTTFPAWVDNVVIDGGTYTGNERGLRFGEPGKGNASPTNVSIHNANISGNVKTYSGMDGSAYGGVVNQMMISINVNATCNWWGAADGPSGSGSGSGDAVTDYVTYSPWLVTPAPCETCIGGTLLGDKFGVRDDLADLTLTGDKKTDDRIEKAIKHIDNSLDDKLWEDGDHLTKKGKKVFDEEKKAVKELKKIVKEKKNDLLKDEAQDAIDKLVAIDEELAQTAIDEAITAGGKTKEIEKAEKEMVKALEDIAKDKFDKAIDHFKKAWEHALKAVKNLAKSSSDDDTDLIDSVIPDEFNLAQNYPNPFNPTTSIQFSIPEAGNYKINVYNILGVKVAELVDGNYSPGVYNVQFDASNLPSGIYVYQLLGERVNITNKMILMK